MPNVTLPLTGSGDSTKVAATDTIAGVEYPYAKLVSGTTGSTTPINAGGGAEANAMRVTTADDSPIGAETDSEATGNGSVIAILKRLRTLLGTIAGAINQRDAPAAGGEYGMVIFGVRSDGAETALVSTDGDLSPIAIGPSGEVYIEGHVMADVTPIGATDDAEATGDGSVIAILKRLRTLLGTIAGAVKTGDAVAGGTDTGIPPLAIRDDAIATVSQADGDWTHLRTNHAGALWVSIGGTASPLSTYVDGGVAHGEEDDGSPVKMGFQARTTNPTAVDDADRVNGIADDIGRQVVAIGQVRDLIVQQTATLTNTTETTILAQASGVYHDLVSLDITNESATAVVVTIRDTTGGSAVQKFAIAANGGISKTYTRPWKQTSVNTNWTAQLSATATVHINVQAEKNV